MKDIKKILDKGNSYYDSGRYEIALDYYFQVLDIEPNNIDALINIGLCYRHLKEYEKAILYYDKVLDIEPDNEVALNNKGYVYECMGELEKAILLYEKALEIKPDYDRPLVNLTNIYIDRKQYDKTIPIYLRALEVDHLNVANWIDLGRAYRFLGEYKKSIDAYKQALKLDPFNKIAWNNIGYAYYCAEDYYNAIKAYKESLKIDWLYDLPYINLVKLYKEMVKNRTNENDPIKWYKVAKAFYIAKEYTRALDAIEVSLELESENEKFLKLKKKILRAKRKYSFEKPLKNQIEKVLEKLSRIATSAYVYDVIDYIKHKFEKKIFNDEEIMFKILEVIDEKRMWIKLDGNKLIFYNKDDGKSKVNYL